MGGGTLTTKGDLESFTTVQERLPVGTNDQVLTADSTAASGVAWKTAAGGGGSAATAHTGLTGTIDPTASTSVVGIGTLFTTELVVGDIIDVSGQEREVATITTNTALTVTVAFSNLLRDDFPNIVDGVKGTNYLTALTRDSQGSVKLEGNATAKSTQMAIETNYTKAYLLLNHSGLAFEFDIHLAGFTDVGVGIFSLTFDGAMANATYSYAGNACGNGTVTSNTGTDNNGVLSSWYKNNTGHTYNTAGTQFSTVSALTTSAPADFVRIPMYWGHYTGQ